MQECHLEALRFFVNMENRLPVDTEDWTWIREMSDFLRDGTVPKFEDSGDELPGGGGIGSEPASAVQ